MKQNTIKNKKVISILIPALLIFTYILLSSLSFFSLNRLQGNARVINYTGIVRGATQRLMKQEMSRHPNDVLIQRLDEILTELQNGDGENNLIRLGDPAYQELLAQMQADWTRLKEEIAVVRQGGARHQLYVLSEEYFELADQTVSAAETYTEASVRANRQWLEGLNIIFLGLMLLFFIYNRRQRKLWQKLQLAESASREKSEFLSKMSHEIRTPMNGIIGMSAIAKRSLGDREKVEDCLNKIDLSAQFLLSLINDVLDMSRIENGRLALRCSEFVLAELLDGIESMFIQKAEDAHIAFSVQQKNLTAHPVIGDELRINQVLINILSNAIKFTPDGGTVSLKARQAAVTESGVTLEFVITDSGIGMSKEFMQHMFEPFEQELHTDAQRVNGTGLGLSISYHLVTMMGGEITADSREGEGTRFVVRIPVALADQAQEPCKRLQEAPDATADYDFSGSRILVAEDNEINAEIVMTMLGYTGAEVTHVWNGKEAVESFASAGPGGYDLILMDVQMPEMDGLEAVQAIRGSGQGDAQKVPVIALTANAFSSDMEEALECGMNDFLAKPIDFEQMYRTIAGYVRKPS